MKKIICASLLLFANATWAQIKLPLTLIDGYGPFAVDMSYVDFSQPPSEHPLSKSVNSLQYNGIPSSLKSVEKGIIWIDFLQFLYQNVQAGNLAADVYDQFRKERKISVPEENLSKQPIDCYVLVVKGVNEAGEEVLLIDDNQDKNFENDMAVVAGNYQSSQDFENLVHNSLQINYQSVSGGKIVVRTIPLSILKSNDRYFYSFPQYAVAKINVEHKEYAIAVSNQFRFPNYQAAYITLLSQQKAPKDSIFRIGQYLQIGAQLYENNGVDFSSLSLLLTDVDKSSTSVSSSQKGMPAVPFVGKNVVTGNEIDLNDFKGKYLFIDFWGTWCSPCVAQLPGLSKIYSTIDKSKIAFLGVAGKDNIDKLKKMVSSKNIPWPNVLSDNENLIVEKYNIVSYPTGILIDPDGKVIETDISGNDLEMVLKKYL